MTNTSITIQKRTEEFAIRVIKAYTKINKNNHFNDAAVVISKQFLRSGTSIGANISEGIYAQSNKDFISKYSIAIKEASECRYWIKIMIKSEVVSEKKMILLLEEVNNIIRILTTIINKLKAKEKLPITYYLLPITHYLLPITYYLLPITYYLLPIVHPKPTKLIQ